MRRFFLFVFGLSFVTAFAQRHEIGGFIGGANIIGDIGRSNYINPAPVGTDIPITLGVLYRFNFNGHMGFRLSATYGNPTGDDRYAPEYYKKERGYKFTNNIYEGALVFEYNFFDFNSIQKNAFSPYIFGGIGAFSYNYNTYQVNHQLYRDADGVAIDPTSESDFESTITGKKKSRTGFTTPFGFGLKVKTNYNWVISAEVGFRYTKYDDLDLSYADYKDFKFTIVDAQLNDPIYANEIETRNSNAVKSRQVGNTSNPDWYVFTGIGVTYTFGRPPCYCD